MAVGQPPQPRQAFIPGVVKVEIGALQVFTPLAAAVETCEQGPGILAGALADNQFIALHAAGLVDEGRGGGPVGVVEHRVVQGHQDAVKYRRVGSCVKASLLMFLPAGAAVSLSGYRIPFRQPAAKTYLGKGQLAAGYGQGEGAVGCTLKPVKPHPLHGSAGDGSEYRQ